MSSNKEIIERYGNNPEVIEEMMQYLLLYFREDPHQNTIGCVKQFLKEESLVERYAARVDMEKEIQAAESDDPNLFTGKVIIDADFKELDEEEIESSEVDRLINDGDWA